MRRFLLSIAVLFIWSAQPAPAQPPAKPPAAATPKPAPPAAESYSYDPEGRRDPFVSLTNRGSDVRAPMRRPDGVSGLLVDEVSLKGIVRSKGMFVAMLQAPDSRTYLVRSGDRLFDGAVKVVTAEAITFLQDVTDPLSPVKQREVRRLLRAFEEGK